MKTEVSMMRDSERLCGQWDSFREYNIDICTICGNVANIIDMHYSDLMALDKK